MAIAIKHIDKIAREKQRTVLSLEFHPEPTFHSNCIDTQEDHDKWRESVNRISAYKYREDKVRDEILENLTKLNIPYEMCAEWASESGFSSYKGQVYLDVPLDLDLPLCQKLHQYLEYPDGSMRFPTVRFYFWTLEVAMKNAHHDEPGFWDNWAENF
ncbi:MAG: hypothetical protein WCJ11_00850 [Methylococcaceae bacterium]